MSQALGGAREMRTKMQHLAKQFPEAVERALYQEAEVVMKKAKERTPVDTGALRASGHVLRPKRESGRSIYVELVYGGAAAAYALIVHETPPSKAAHPIGQWKYLESAILEAAPNLANRIGARLQQLVFGRM